MFLDEILTAQKRGEARGIPSICSSHPSVIKQTLEVSKVFGIPALIDATCNQVNQFGGYTGMTPVEFAAYVRRLADESNYPFEDILLGGDHLGPSVWQDEPAERAMDKAGVLVREYVRAGFAKIHLDCSMRLSDDPAGPLDVEVSARRAAQLAKAAEDALIPGLSPAGRRELRYVIGTEVPVPGGATVHEDRVGVTTVEAAQQSIEVTWEAFRRDGLEPAWNRVIALVVQPGVEFGDDFVLPYRPAMARPLSQFLETQPLVYEAHSTDYQTPEALKDLVRDHFAILKVGPALTFAFREAIFALAMIENELFRRDQRSNLIQVLDDVMLKYPAHWKKYYHGTEREQAYKRKYSLSDRARYYWAQPEVTGAFNQLMENLGNRALPYALLSQYVGESDLDAAQVIQKKINNVLNKYFASV